MAVNYSPFEEQQQNIDDKIKHDGEIEYKRKIFWSKVGFFVFLHLSFLYGIYLGFTSSNLKTAIFIFIYGYAGGVGVTAGMHRLWTHRSYQARWPLRVLLMIFATIAGQSDIYIWCRDHRVHHKFTETDADPYNIKRGFFFAHIGWLMCNKHPSVKEKGKTVSMDDLWADPIVRFHKRFYIPMALFFCYYLPIMIPVWCWEETVWNSFFGNFVRLCLLLNFTFLVNSAAHYTGDKPFDKNIEAREIPVVSLLAIGEGWHNYHHVFPWDYATSELGYTLNFTKMFIDFMAFIGLAYDLKTAHPESVKNRKLKTGDGSRLKNVNSEK